MILSPLMGTVEVTEAWVSMATWSEASRLAILVVSVCVLGLALYNTRQLQSWKHRVTLVALRTLLVCSLVGIFFQPALLVEKRANEPAHLMVLLDTSSSMNLPQGGAGSPTRREGVADFLDRHGTIFDELEANHELHVFTVDGDLEPLDGLPDTAALSALDHNSASTRLLSALERIH